MLPRVIVYTAISADGRIDWFTADIGLYYGLVSTWNEDATLGGSNTLLAAGEKDVPDEDETVFENAAPQPGDRRPLLVVPDSRGRIRTWHYWRKQPYWRDVVVLCSHATPGEYLDYLVARDIDTIIAGDDHVDLRAALEELATRYGVRTVRVDSGGTLNGVLLRAGLVDEVSLLVHPTLVGGISSRSFFRAPDLTSPEGVIPLRLMDLTKLNDDIVWLRYRVLKSDE